LYSQFISHTRRRKRFFVDSILLLTTEATCVKPVLELMQYFYLCGNVEENTCLVKVPVVG
jgi:hypothetical protein